MKIERILDNKKQFLDLLLLADEQENMIDKYLLIEHTANHKLIIKDGKP